MVKHLKVTISGSPLEGKNLDLYEKSILDKMSKSTTEPAVQRYNFAMLYFRYEITAVDLELDKIDSLHKQILKLTGVYLTKWTYAININYTESSGE